MVFVYIFYEPTMGFGMPLTASYIGGAIVAVVITAIFFIAAHKKRGTSFVLDEDVSAFNTNP